MGDNLAVEIANSAHEGVLKRLAGGLREDEQIVHRSPFPRGPFYEMLNIDDHTGLQVVGPGAGPPAAAAPRRDRELFARCDEVYAQVGLVQHPGKKTRCARRKVAIGAEIDGTRGLVSAPAIRTTALARLTLQQVILGRSTPALFVSI
eukprot:10947168-Lingulodinium_polyedra.AAC.1